MGLIIMLGLLAYASGRAEETSVQVITAIGGRELAADAALLQVALPSPSALPSSSPVPNSILVSTGSDIVTTVLDLTAMLAGAPPAPAAFAQPDSSASKLSSPLAPGARAPDVFYERPGGRYQCKALGRLDFERPTHAGALDSGSDPITQAVDRRGVRSSGALLAYGAWRVAYPRFLSPEHEAWFFRYEIQRQRWER